MSKESPVLSQGEMTEQLYHFRDLVMSMFLLETSELSEDDAERISNENMQVISIGQEKSGDFNELKQDFVCQVLPNLDENDHRKAIWQGLEKFKQLHEQLLSSTDEIESDEDWEKFIDLVRALSDPLEAVTNLYNDQGLYETKMMLLFRSLNHDKARTNATGILGFWDLYSKGDCEKDEFEEIVKSGLEELKDIEGLYEAIQRAIIGNDLRVLTDYRDIFKKTFKKMVSEKWGESAVLINIRAIRPKGEVRSVIEEPMVRSIVENLLTNIKKHGEISEGDLTKIYLWLGISKERELLMIVGDNGRGFEGEAFEEDENGKQRAFEKDYSTSGGGEGLAIVYDVVKAMGGRLKLVQVEEVNPAIGINAFIQFNIPVEVD